MTGVQTVGVLLIAAGLIYAVAYAGWIRRSRKYASGTLVAEPASGTPAPDPGTEQGATRAADDDPTPHAGTPRTMTMATAEGMYIGTTLAMTRHERVNAASGGAREPAAMVVDETSIRWERVGADEIRVPGTRLLGVSLERRVAARALGRARIVLVSWHAENGDRYATAFLPHHRVETADLVRAVQRLMTSGPQTRDAHAHGASSKNSQTGSGRVRHDQDDTTPDGPL